MKCKIAKRAKTWVHSGRNLTGDEGMTESGNAIWIELDARRNNYSCETKCCAASMRRQKDRNSGISWIRQRKIIDSEEKH